LLMKNTTCKLLLVSGALFVTSAFGNSIVIYNTGVDQDGNLLPGAAVDPHYAMVQSPDPNYPGPNAMVTLHNLHFPLPQGWFAESKTSTCEWISPRAVEGNGTSKGTYIYETTFDLTGLNPSTAMLKGQLAAESNSLIRLNGVILSIDGSGFGAYTPFTITSGFIAGVNTLDFIVVHSDPIRGWPDATGLRVKIHGTASPNPEASSRIRVSPARVASPDSGFEPAVLVDRKELASPAF
jgi:hypothetical protein